MREYYFSIVTVFLVVLTLLAFSDNLITDVRQESNSDPKFIVHGLFCLAWMIVLAVQANLIRTWRYVTHRNLGIASIFIAAGVTVSTLYVFYDIWEGWDKLVFYGRPNRFFLPSFAVLVTLGYLFRDRPVLHKRFMFVATLLMLEPILNRLPLFGVSPFIRTPVIWNGLFLSLFIYDWKTLGRVHPISYIVFIWVYIAWVIAFLT